MNFNNKCLMVLKASEPFHAWLQNLVQMVEDSLKQDFKHNADEKMEVSLEQMQNDANCYVIPLLAADEATAFIENHTQQLFEIELNTWCSMQALWPAISFSNLIFSFSFDFYFDWMSFQSDEIPDETQDLSSILLLLKPNEHFAHFLHAQLLERRHLSTEILGQELSLSLIQEGSTSVVTDIHELDEVDYFLDQHAEELISHQLEFWGGKPMQESWSAGFDVKALREFFSVEIHRHVHVMLH